jgi:hypothetical protein
MRSFLLFAPLLSILTLFPNPGGAGDRLPRIEVLKRVKPQTLNPTEETYRGYNFYLSGIAGRQDFKEMTNAMHHQLDIVESVGFSLRVLGFFHSIPIAAEELACLEKEFPTVACYGASGMRTFGAYVARAYRVWDNENSQWINANRAYVASESGVVMVRPLLLSEEKNPVMLHEFLHAFHSQIMPQGFQNEGILFHYNQAKSKQLYPEDKYLMKNEREFFAVTASIFLYGKDAAHEPFTRSNLKEKQPDYFKYLVGLFEFDPDRTPSASPVASAY